MKECAGRRRKQELHIELVASVKRALRFLKRATSLKHHAKAFGIVGRSENAGQTGHNNKSKTKRPGSVASNGV